MASCTFSSAVLYGYGVYCLPSHIWGIVIITINRPRWQRTRVDASAMLAVPICRLGTDCRHGRHDCRVFMRPVESGAGHSRTASWSCRACVR